MNYGYPHYDPVHTSQPPPNPIYMSLPVQHQPPAHHSPHVVHHHHPPPPPQQTMTNSTNVVVNTGGGGGGGGGGSAADKARNWYSGLFGCCADIGVCCAVYCCPACVLCHLSNKMGEGCCMPCCVPMSLMALRIKLRSEEGIVGNIQTDCCVTSFCTFCALAQLKREFDTITKLSKK